MFANKDFLRKNKNSFTIAILLSMLVLAVLFAANSGSFKISLIDLLTNSLSDLEKSILFSIRLPRIFLGLLVGAALACCGAAMQGLFRNPLADPGLIGVSSGAALGVGIVIILFAQIGISYNNFFGIYGLSIAAFIGGFVACLIVFNFAKAGGNFSVAYMLLAGIAINAIAGAATGFLTYISDDGQLRALTFWTMGNLGGALWVMVIVATTIILPVILVIIFNAKNINLMMLGEDEARYLGVNISKLKLIIVICTALAVGMAVAVSGIIGFIGLVVPHLIRLTIGADHRLLLPASAIGGAVLLIFADTISRIIVAPAEMPVGILTSIIGGPFFLYLIYRSFNKNVTS